MWVGAILLPNDCSRGHERSLIRRSCCAGIRVDAREAPRAAHAAARKQPSAEPGLLRQVLTWRVKGYYLARQLRVGQRRALLVRALREQVLQWRALAVLLGSGLRGINQG
jgi:hypothetical protein